MSRLVAKDKRTGKMTLRQRMSRHPYFVHLRDAAGRKRDFRPEKQALYDAMWPLCVQRADLATSVVTFNGSKLADELSPKDENGDVIPETRVEPSRISRLFEEWERYGLIERPDLEMDPVTGYCMPRHIVLTDQFWQLCGIDMNKFLAERNNSPDLRQKEIIKITNKVFIPAFCVDKFNAFACSGRTRPRRSELKD